MNYVIASPKGWTRDEFRRRAVDLPGTWNMVQDRQELTLEFLDRTKPRYVFFPHWSWLVPAEILDAYECVCFHMTDLPYGRGGSPLQNLVVRGHSETKLTALRMVEEIDSGPIYMKMPLSLAGSAQEIFTEATKVIFDMIETIVRQEPQPNEQQGAPTYFKRRKPEQGVIPKTGTIQDIYNHIRMLDADTYPRAFLDWGFVRVEFADAEYDPESGELKASVRFVTIEAKEITSS